MNHNFSLKFKIADIFAIITGILLGVVFIVTVTLTNSHSDVRMVHVYHNNELIERYDTDLNTLSETRTISLDKDELNLLGEFVIEMDKEKGIRVSEVTCPNHTCEKQGWVNIDNLPIICIPNSVEIIIEAKDASTIVL